MKKFGWTKLILETFLEESGINERIELGDEKAIILEGITRTRWAGWDQEKQAEKFGISKRTVNNYIKEIIELYNMTQKDSLILPVIKDQTKWEKENGMTSVDED